MKPYFSYVHDDIRARERRRRRINNKIKKWAMRCIKVFVLTGAMYPFAYALYLWATL